MLGRSGRQATWLRPSSAALGKSLDVSEHQGDTPATPLPLLPPFQGEKNSARYCDWKCFGGSENMILGDLRITPRVAGKQGRAQVPTRMHKAVGVMIAMVMALPSHTY